MSEQLHVEATSHPHQYIVHNVPIIDRGDREFNDVYVNFSGYFGRHGPQVFAAAPELLEALECAVACGMVPTSSQKDGGASAKASQVIVADMIRAAIAKATGEA